MYFVLGPRQFVNALTIGAIYALVALGYTMVYGIIELINFAHGDVFMVGAFVSLFVLDERPRPDGLGHQHRADRASMLASTFALTMAAIGDPRRDHRAVRLPARSGTPRAWRR